MDSVGEKTKQNLGRERMGRRKLKKVQRYEVLAKGVSAGDLEDLVGHRKYFAGIFSDHQLDKVMVTSLPISLIINIASAHWISIYISDGRIEIFDPLGGVFIREKADCIRNFVARYMNCKTIYLSPRLQHDDSNLCGLFATHFIISKSQEKSFKKIVSTFDCGNDKGTNDTYLLNKYTY